MIESYRGVVLDREPHFGFHGVDNLVGAEAENLLEALHAQFVDALGHERVVGLDRHFNLGAVFDDDSELGVAVAEQTAVVDVRTSDQRHVVVHDHHLRVHVDLFRGPRAVLPAAVLSQAEEHDVLARIVRVLPQSA